MTLIRSLLVFVAAHGIIVCGAQTFQIPGLVVLGGKSQVLDLGELFRYARLIGFDRARDRLIRTVEQDLHSVPFIMPSRTYIPPSEQPNEETVNKDVSDLLFESDILLTKPQLDAILISNGARRSKRKVVSDNTKRWNLPIHFTFEQSNLSAVCIICDLFVAPKTQVVIKRALRFWEQNTCIKFQETSADYSGDMLKFDKGVGCFSNIGNVGGKQIISIGDGCEYLGIVIHELGHTLGFWHEQSRFDRNDYVSIDPSNVHQQQLFNFWKWAHWRMVTFAEYDYGSIMHYKATAFALDIKKPVIHTKDQHYQQTIGQRIVASFIDVMQMNRAYECIETNCPGVSIECQNGGYIDPNSCTSCICPTGYGGTECADIPESTGEDCGGLLEAKTHWQTFNFKRSTSALFPSMCIWHIKSGGHENIELKIEKNFVASCTDACYEDYLEIKKSENPQITGFRTCCAAEGNIIETNSTLVPVIAYSQNKLKFSLSFRYKPSAVACPPEGGTWGAWRDWEACTHPNQKWTSRRRDCLTPGCSCIGRDAVHTHCA